MKNTIKLTLMTILCVLPLSLRAEFEQPFKWDIHYDSEKRNAVVEARVPAGYYLYEKSTRITFTAAGKPLKPSKTPVAVDHEDDSGTLKIYSAGDWKWLFPAPSGTECVAKIEFQGCRDKTADSSAICFMPDTITLRLAPAKAGEQKQTTHPPSNPTRASSDIFSGFLVEKTGGGFMEPETFLAFLGTTATENDARPKTSDDDALNLDKMGIFGLVIFILLGGLALNLTPCVLPMMPINLAIIGAGGVGISKKTGFIRGGVYGTAIALSYGILGLLAMFAGAKFGSLNSSPWFNLAIAVVFLVLALAMFDIITIDFSRYRTNLDFKKKDEGAPLAAVFAMGVVSALLAGACVAPVVIAALLYSMTEYSEGNTAALLLPFILGVGMALPWPIVGGGLASLPKPGKWMVRVKQAMGVFIIAMSAYYAWLGIAILAADNKATAADSMERLKTALKQSSEENRPVFIDFWATWCKNCSRMEHSTFKNPKVERALRKYIIVKFQAEDPNQPDVKRILDEFKIMGLPGYVILRPNN
ncbi:MAG: DUF255 domain-containing protein [Kiritimatiellaeota bacterium]|nr:DUF255 domain-containing protein [Kiritimatiellota bacterium]